jgi:uncharacterized Zn-finger protein
VCTGGVGRNWSDRHFTDHFGNWRESAKIEVLHAQPDGEHMNQNKTPLVELEGKDLPAHCPNPAMPLWSSHPRVFLDFNHDGLAKCPYCGTVYLLKPGTVLAAH